MPSQPNEEARTHATAVAGSTLDRSLDLVRFLRKNCPWDGAQTPQSLVPFLLEEAHEVADAISTQQTSALAAELGDLLLNVAFQIVLAEEHGEFTAEHVIAGLEQKMRRRHPHLYGGEKADWESLKSLERAESGNSILQGLARGLDPLSKAHRIQERVSTVGFDWSDARGAFDKVAEELEEVREAMAAEPSPALAEELGDLMFAVVNLARLSGTHALHALQQANHKFGDRFERLEALAAQRGVILGSAKLAELDALWDEVKRTG